MLKDGTVYAMVAVRDIAAAEKFYADTLGLEKVDQNPGGMTFKSGSGKLFLYQAPTGGQNPATSAAWDVDSIEAVVEDLKSKGVAFEHYDGFPVEWQGDIAVMGPMKAAWFKDSDGNTLQLGSTEKT